jgi:phosphatidate phosphatase APP1
MYPEQRVILIGDSGQEDPEIYREIVREYPQRVLCCYIRNVSGVSPRGAALKVVAADVAQAGSMMVVVEDTNGAARHAADKGWIGADSLREIAKEEAQVEKLPR